MATTYYRIHPGHRPAETLLRPGQVSRVWSGEAERTCEACNGQGLVMSFEDEDDAGTAVRCEACSGVGRVEDVRRGVSCCASLEDLVAYMRDRAPTLRGALLVEMTGEPSEDEDWEADCGAVLVHPTAIVRAVPVEESEVWDELQADAE